MGKQYATNTQTILQHMLADLARSGLTVTHAKTMRCRPLLTLAPYGYPNYQGYLLPYLTLDKQLVTDRYHRVRTFVVAALNGHQPPPRYLQPPGSTPRLYFPPFCDWGAISINTAIPICITEGEKKAALATLRGFPTIGLGGVHSFQAKKKGLVLLPDFDLIQWSGRPVSLVFDSDISHNLHVQHALLSLSQRLTSDKSARMTAIYLPRTATGQKQGLDDFLLAHGDAAFNQLEREPFEPELWAFNERYAVITDTMLYLDVRTGHLYKTQDFHMLTLPVKYRLTTVQPTLGQATTRVVQTSRRWLGWAGRREHPSLAFEPGQPPVLADGSLNLYTPPAIVPVPMPADKLQLYRTLVEFLFQDAPAMLPWFERWAAYPLQHPGTKLYSAFLMHGVQNGTGKSLLGMLVGACHGHNFGVVERDQLYSTFTPPGMLRKTFVLGDEVFGSDRRQDADQLKTLVTRESMMVNIKNLRTYTVRDCANWFLTSNHVDAIYLDPTDRRFGVVRIEAPPLPREVYDQLDAWRRSGEAAAHLLHHLLQVDLTGFNPHAAPPMTEAKQTLRDHSLSEVEAWVKALRDDPERVLAPPGAVPVAGDLLTSTELVMLYNARPDLPTSKQIQQGTLKKSLDKYEFKKAAIKIANPWIVRNRDRWEAASYSEKRAHYERTRLGFKIVSSGQVAKVKF